MKVTMLNKTITTSVIALVAHEALRMVAESEEAHGLEMVSAKVTKIDNPGAVAQVARFAQDTGTYVLGYFEGLVDHLPTYEGSLWVWSVTLELVYTADYQPKPFNGADLGELANKAPEAPDVQGFDPDQPAAPVFDPDKVVDPNDRAGLTEKQRTEGDI